MTFWNHLWTKEGMATFLSSYAANTYLPSMKLMEFFTVDELRNGLVIDSSASHPLVPPAQYGPFFDVITYSKGGSIFRMIHNYVGNDDFVASLKHYLTKFSYKTAITEQLFAVMTTTINKFNVSNYFDCWVYQMGYPLVTVTRDSSNTNGGIVNQARYLSNTNANPSVDNPTSPYKSTCGYKWNIPITYVTSNNPTTTMKANFYKNTSNLQISWPNNTWIKANIDQIGFYRVNYDLSNWDALATALQIDHSVLSNLDIASLLDDAFQFAANDMVDYMAPLNLTKYLSKEIDFLPWHTANKHLDTIGGRLAGSSYYQDYIQYHLQILKPAVDTLGVIDIGTDIEKIPGSLREVAFRTGIEYGSVQEWDFVYNIYRTTLIPTERSSAFYAMSFPRDPYIINRYLQFATDPTKIDPSNSMTVFVFLTFNPVGRDLVWEYVRQNTGYFMNRFKSTRPIVNIASRRLNSQFRLNQVKQFFKDHPESGPNAAASEAQTIAAINANIKYLNKYGKTFSTWFKQNIKMD
ncbi:uncharacterized protein TRIADDRAFT_57042 [Trichoplax adhaerens]|uniref:Peptidase M1 membrane alanine aminopeptidase domain-containing protein n=1 Tax=Trichoplax adhaerens TaxID=10228 RepID=B3S0G7_TRIAD|nr:hypothetical protein TRIADDRAFT_57042 [Trichoplax adhaerens]EDV23636.1 hypothetical protein TRIADDRAFT_57042 [Trichoplax adhaerens]|eukprot:XP_002113162.1 hypothetical protein TRIADDRAFT_57042 [Trichoplax adhaerens]